MASNIIDDDFDWSTIQEPVYPKDEDRLDLAYPYSKDFDAGLRLLNRWKYGKRKYKKRKPKNSSAESTPLTQSQSSSVITHDDDDFANDSDGSATGGGYDDYSFDVNKFESTAVVPKEIKSMKKRICEEALAFFVCILYCIIFNVFLKIFFVWFKS